jgi:ABC-type transport system involved in multi-copper enzyme maturation permease subunit
VLFWAPRRLTVMGVKLGVLVVATALFGVVMQLGWLAMAGILRAVAGSDNGLPPGFWGDLLATQGRAVLLVVLVALLGFGLANLVRNTGAALGVGFVYFAIVETAVRILRPTWEPWLLSDNAVGLLAPGGTVIYIQDGTPGPNGLVQPTEYVIGSLQGGVLLGAVTVVVVGIGVVLFARRDIH